MTLTLREVLKHPLLRNAEPVLLSGQEQLDHAVRWVHTADLYDIAPLLRGDEVLLTNGVGLLGVDEEARRVYVQRLADRGIAGLFFEVGRTFDDIPSEMIGEARRLQLPIVVLQPVLRFTEVAEAVNSELIDHSVARLRHADLISRGLSETLAGGGSLVDITEQVATALGTWAEVGDFAGRVVVSVGDVPVESGSDVAQVPILVEGTGWGRLRVGTKGLSDVLVDAVLDRAPTVIGLCLIRHQPEVASALRVRQLVLDQLVAGQQTETLLLRERLHAAGVPTSHQQLVCVAMDPGRVVDGARLLDQLIRNTGHGIFGLAGGTLCAVIAGHSDAAMPSLGLKVREAARRSILSQARSCAAIGRTISNLSDLPRSMVETRASLRIAETLHGGQPVVWVQSLAIERLLETRRDDPELHQFVTDQLGPLLESDVRKGGRLIRTLEALVDCGGAKTAAAELLHLRRQSLYYRLRQISSLVDVDLDDPKQLMTLSVALIARRLMSSNDQLS